MSVYSEAKILGLGLSTPSITLVLPPLKDLKGDREGAYSGSLSYLMEGKCLISPESKWREIMT